MGVSNFARFERKNTNRVFVGMVNPPYGGGRKLKGIMSTNHFPWFTLPLSYCDGICLNFT